MAMSNFSKMVFRKVMVFPVFQVGSNSCLCELPLYERVLYLYQQIKKKHTFCKNTKGKTIVNCFISPRDYSLIVITKKQKVLMPSKFFTDPQTLLKEKPPVQACINMANFPKQYFAGMFSKIIVDEM